MSKLFERTRIKGLNIPNRFIRSATWEGMAKEDGACSRELADLMVQLARGGVGLIITGHSYVSVEGQAGPRQLGIHRDDFISGLKKMTDAVHEVGGRIVMQLAHAGCQAAGSLTRREALGASVMTDKHGPLNREMTVEDIRNLVDAFGRGAARAAEAGFDGVQLHAAHGYLLSQFLSPHFNRRKDEYGGSTENRARIVLEVLQSIRTGVGEDFPVMMKMNSQDFLEDGLKTDESAQIATMLAKAGIDAIEVSGGTVYSGKFAPVRRGKIESQADEVYYRSEAGKFKEKIGVPLMLVGGIRSFEVAGRLAADGVADYVSLCRPLIREPDLVNRWKSGDLRKSACLSDNLCFRPAMAGDGLYCVVEKKAKQAK